MIFFPHVTFPFGISNTLPCQKTTLASSPSFRKTKSNNIKRQKCLSLFPIRRPLGSYENLPNASLKPAHYNKIYKWRQLSMNWKLFLFCHAHINEEGSLGCHSRGREGLPILTTCPPEFPCTLRSSWWFLNRPCFVSLCSLLSGQ